MRCHQRLRSGSLHAYRPRSLFGTWSRRRSTGTLANLTHSAFCSIMYCDAVGTARAERGRFSRERHERNTRSNNNVERTISGNQIDYRDQWPDRLKPSRLSNFLESAYPENLPSIGALRLNYRLRRDMNNFCFWTGKIWCWMTLFPKSP